MKTRLRVFGLALALIALVWVVDAAIDAAFFYEGTFLDLLFRELPPIELYWRALVAIPVLLFAVILSSLLARVQAGHEVEARAQAFLQTIIDGLPESITVINLDYSIALANRAAQELTGGVDPVSAGLGCHQISHGSATPCAGGGHPCPLDLVVETRVPVTVEHIHHDAGGQPIHVEVTAAPVFDGEGEVVQIIESCRDITERKEADKALQESETRYRSLFDQANDLIFLLELVPDGPPIIRDANQVALLALGYTRDELLGKPISMVDAADSAEAVAQERQRSVLERKTTFEVHHRRKDGSVFPVEAAVREVTIGEQRLAISIERDLTERWRMEDELRDSRDRLRKLTTRMDTVRDEERTALARELHDDVGQALTAMRIDLHIIEGALPEREETVAHRLHSMIDITDDAIIRVNRLSHELRSPVLEILGLEAAVEAAAEEIGERTGLEVELDLHLAELEGHGERDTTVLRIFNEAMSNVTRHARASRVEVGLRVVEERMVLEVLDDGVGIPNERLRNKRSFGLIGMRERVERLGGTLEIERRPEGGTRIRASVPIAPENG